MRQIYDPRFAVIAAFLACVPIPAFAYIDPGTGSMLIQSLLAAVAAVLVFGRGLWHRVKSAFRRDKDKSQDSGSH